MVVISLVFLVFSLFYIPSQTAKAMEEGTVLQNGDNNEEVQTLKENLIKLGFQVGMNFPTSYGPSTESTVKEFQEYYGLTVTGIADEVTLTKVKDSLNSSLRKGQNNEETRVLKENLMELGFEVGMNFPTSYGPSTESSVKEFQEYYDLKVNGIGDSITLGKVEELVNSSLEYGFRAPIVYELNKQLKALSYDVATADYYDRKTEAAIMEVQNEFGLEVTGVADVETLNQLDKLSDNPLRKGKHSEEAVILKENLNRLGFEVSMNYPTSFGPSTEKAVKEFQEYYSLSITGIGDTKTLAKIEETLNSPLQRGKNNNETAVMKENLNLLGFSVGMSYPTSYGPSTEKTVKEFQEYYGLKVNGIGDSVTLAKLEEITDSELTYGLKRPDVTILKEDLKEAGFEVVGNPIDYYGETTERAVREFQEYYGLKVTGVTDDETRAKLNQVLNSPLRIGNNNDETVVMKENLNRLGFEVGMNYPNSYGPSTERTVRDFQVYYDLVANGIGDDVTLAKMDEILNSSLSLGNNNNETQSLKETLNSIGFEVGMNFPTSYGPSTESTVKEFQKYYGLKVNGIGDQVTLATLEKVSNDELSFGLKRPDVLSLKYKLSDLGFHVSNNPTDYYGSTTTKIVKEFQTYYGLEPSGNAGEETVEKIENLLNSPLRNGQNNQETADLKETLNELGFNVGMNYPTSYGPSTERTVKEFQEYFSLVPNGIGDDITKAKINELLTSPLRKGRNSDEAVALKENLNKLGFEVGMNFPTSYGPSTEKAVLDFQKYNGLKATGIGDEVTLSKIDEILNSPLRLGQNNNATAELKENLNLIGFSVSMNFPTSYGPSTEAVVKDFQKQNNLKVSGIADDKTLTRIKELVEAFSYSENDFADNSIIGYSTANSLNVRSTPNGSQVDSIRRGTRVEILSTYSGSRINSWHRIKYDGYKTGYVSAGYIQLAINKSANSGPLVGKTIYLDPGHGAQDSGGIGGGMLEKDLVLDISNRAEKLLRDAGATVIMTRRTDFFLSLSQRSFLANRSDADVFVSVHANAFNGSAHGTETFWHGGYKRGDSRRLAHALQDATVEKMGTHYRRVEEASYHVIRETQIPSALLEVGFMDHTGDAAKLRQSSYRQRSAEAIRDGLINYFK